MGDRRSLFSNAPFRRMTENGRDYPPFLYGTSFHAASLLNFRDLFRCNPSVKRPFRRLSFYESLSAECLEGNEAIPPSPDFQVSRKQPSSFFFHFSPFSECGPTRHFVSAGLVEVRTSLQGPSSFRRRRGDGGSFFFVLLHESPPGNQQPAGARLHMPRFFPRGS